MNFSYGWLAIFGAGNCIISYLLFLKIAFPFELDSQILLKLWNTFQKKFWCLQCVSILPVEQWAESPLSFRMYIAKSQGPDLLITTVFKYFPSDFSDLNLICLENLKIYVSQQKNSKWHFEKILRDFCASQKNRNCNLGILPLDVTDLWFLNAGI